MTAAQTQQEIRTRGYYRFNFRPHRYERSISLERCRDLVRDNAVSLRGWDFPHFPNRDDGLEIGDAYYQGWVDWSGYKELWRLYQSEQYIMVRSLREDWAGTLIERHPPPGTALRVIGSVVYELTEACEFLARLVRAGLYQAGVTVDIALSGTAGRALIIGDPRRLDLSHDYRASVGEIRFRESFRADGLVPGNGAVAAQVARFILDRFGWHNPSDEVIEKEIAQYLQRRR